MLRPTYRQYCCIRSCSCQSTQDIVLALWIVTNPYKKCIWAVLFASFHRSWQWTLRAHGCHTLVREQQVEPLGLQFIPLIFLLLPPCIFFLLHSLLLFLQPLLFSGALQL